MFAVLLGAVLLIAAAYYGLVVGSMSLVGRWFPRMAVGVGAIATLSMAYWTIDGYVTCAQDPIFVPPDPGEDGEGRMIFPCDAPTGGLDRLFIYVIGPALTGLLGLKTYRHIQGFKV